MKVDNVVIPTVEESLYFSLLILRIFYALKLLLCYFVPNLLNIVCSQGITFLMFEEE